MARPGLRNNPKYKRLMVMLKPAPESHVRGYLECMWETAYECGNPVIGDADAVEAAAYWPGKKGRLFEALLKCGGVDRAGFIEEAPGRPGVYQIHDLYDHAPEYVQKRLKRENKRQAERAASKPQPTHQISGDSDDQNRLPVQPLKDNDLQQNCPDTDRTTAENGGTPAPTPAPTPNPPKPPDGGDEDRRMGLVEHDDPVDSQVRAYFAENTKLIYSPKAASELRRLVDSAGWDGARTCIDEAIAYGARNPIAYAGTVWDGKQAQFRLRAEMKPKPTGTTGPAVRRIDR